MKKLIYMLIAVAGIIMAGCGETGKVEEVLDITGTWELTDIEMTKAAQLGEETIEVKITFNADNSFSLIQTLGAGRPEEFTGTWQLAGNVLSGKYASGKNWGSSYQVSVEGSELRMTPDGGLESYIYRKSR